MSKLNKVIVIFFTLIVLLSFTQGVISYDGDDNGDIIPTGEYAVGIMLNCPFWYYGNPQVVTYEMNGQTITKNIEEGALPNPLHFPWDVTKGDLFDSRNYQGCIAPTIRAFLFDVYIMTGGYPTYAPVGTNPSDEEFKMYNPDDLMIISEPVDVEFQENNKIPFGGEDQAMKLQSSYGDYLYWPYSMHWASPGVSIEGMEKYEMAYIEFPRDGEAIKDILIQQFESGGSRTMVIGQNFHGFSVDTNEYELGYNSINIKVRDELMHNPISDLIFNFNLISSSSAVGPDDGDDAYVELTPDKHNFGNVPRGGYSSPATFSLVNNGPGNATVSFKIERAVGESPQDADQFKIIKIDGREVDDTNPEDLRIRKILPGEKHTVTVVYCPKTGPWLADDESTALLSAIGVVDTHGDSSVLTGTCYGELPEAPEDPKIDEEPDEIVITPDNNNPDHKEDEKNDENNDLEENINLRRVIYSVIDGSINIKEAIQLIFSIIFG